MYMKTRRSHMESTLWEERKGGACIKEQKNTLTVITLLTSINCPNQVIIAVTAGVAFCMEDFSVHRTDAFDLRLHQ